LVVQALVTSQLFSQVVAPSQVSWAAGRAAGDLADVAATVAGHCAATYRRTVHRHALGVLAVDAAAAAGAGKRAGSILRAAKRAAFSVAATGFAAVTLTDAGSAAYAFGIAVVVTTTNHRKADNTKK
jgi:hypothetical protein